VYTSSVLRGPPYTFIKFHSLIKKKKVSLLCFKCGVCVEKKDLGNGITNCEAKAILIEFSP
jgi:hypothetical protein